MRNDKLYTTALWLSLFTILYNVAEGLVSLIMGLNDETLALAGFGADSFIEVISGAGVGVMIMRIRNNPDSAVSKFEVNALRITGASFYLLALALAAGTVVNLVLGNKPETTMWGIVIALISIAVMFFLFVVKRNTGKALGSDAIVADANCTRICIYMSVVLLVSSLLFELTGFAWADAIGAAGLVWFSISEGREAFEKAKGRECDCCD
jgi:divalent metal cation (Fe/Co/Zn/Cd) transporter